MQVVNPFSAPARDTFAPGKAKPALATASARGSWRVEQAIDCEEIAYEEREQWAQSSNIVIGFLAFPRDAEHRV